MLIIISPAKTLDFKTPSPISKYSIPGMLDDSKKLAEKLKNFSAEDISELMDISPSLAYLNYERFQTNGDVYTGLNAASLSEKNIEETQNKLLILSGLYGVLKPLDLIQPYRLEMGTKLGYEEAKNLYSFWKEKVTEKVKKAVKSSGSNTLINLASNEYFKCIDTGILNSEIITPEFKDMKNGKYKIISFYAKKARGLMTRFIIENNIDDAEKLQAFDADGYHYNPPDGYHYNPRLSKDSNPVFTRG